MAIIYVYFLLKKILQCCVGFCHRTTWISHNYTYIPSLLPLSPLLLISLCVITEHQTGLPGQSVLLRVCGGRALWSKGVGNSRSSPRTSDWARHVGLSWNWCTTCDQKRGDSCQLSSEHRGNRNGEMWGARCVAFRRHFGAQRRFFSIVSNQSESFSSGGCTSSIFPADLPRVLARSRSTSTSRDIFHSPRSSLIGRVVFEHFESLFRDQPDADVSRCQRPSTDQPSDCCRCDPKFLSCLFRRIFFGHLDSPRRSDFGTSPDVTTTERPQK